MKSAPPLLAIILSVGCLASTVTAEVAERRKPKKKSKQPRIEVCFVLDTTGSMSGMIQGAKDKVWSIASEMMSAQPVPRIKFGLIAYRDRGDAYVTKQIEMTEDLDEIHTRLMAFQANGGGDGPESVNQALREAVENMSWSKNRRVLKIVFLVGDAPPHMDYNETQYPAICKLAMEKDLIINTIQCGTMNGTREIWQDIASRSEGQYSAILQNGGTIVIQTPFDAEIARLNSRLNRTICAYGGRVAQSNAKSKLSSQAEAKPEAVADRATFFEANRQASEMGLGGSPNRVISGTDDLVEMFLDGTIQWDDIDSEKLPEDLKKLTKEQRDAELNQRADLRKRFQAEMADLVKKRSAYLKRRKEEESKAPPVSGFDLEIKKIIREQAGKKDIHFDES